MTLSRSLASQCFRAADNGYEYTLCFDPSGAAGTAQQGQAGLGGSAWSIGTFDGVKGAGTYSIAKGQLCPQTGADSGGALVVECGEGAAALSNVTEPTACFYEMVLQSPYACPPPARANPIEDMQQAAAIRAQSARASRPARAVPVASPGAVKPVQRPQRESALTEQLPPAAGPVV
jgi:hypothetical protein